MSAAVSLLVFTAGCSAIIDASSTPVACESSAGCPAGQVCVDGTCGDLGIDCDDPTAREICDGRDNDCNGSIDEGHDLDGDQATWCGGGVPEQVDCDDNDPRRYPDAVEVCDGADNDCDDEVDEEACDPGEACNAFAGECEPFNCNVHGCPLSEGGCDGVSGQCTGSDCRDDGPPCAGIGMGCDPFTGRCVDQRGPIGSPCTSHFECLSGFCLDLTVVRVGGDSFCSQLCCTNADCPGGFVCWASGSGTLACVSEDEIERGVESDGAECTAGGECVSALCGDAGGGGACVGPCCTDTDCTSGSCGMVQAAGRPGPDLVLACRAGAGIGGFGDPCLSNGDCQSSLCLEHNYCTKGCCQSAACGEGYACIYAGTLGTEDYFRVCAYRADIFGGIGNGGIGAGCTMNQDCRSTFCDRGNCTDVCCSDADCPKGWACRARTLDTGFATICQIE